MLNISEKYDFLKLSYHFTSPVSTNPIHTLLLASTVHRLAFSPLLLCRVQFAPKPISPQSRLLLYVKKGSINLEPNPKNLPNWTITGYQTIISQPK